MKKILIIEDNTDFRNMLVLFLREKGFEVDDACDAIEGCDMCADKRYDLVLMDIFLPEKDGVHAIHQLKEEFSGDIKIIAMTGAYSEGRSDYVLNLSMNQGAEAVLKKPFELKTLIETIYRVIGDKSP